MPTFVEIDDVQVDMEDPSAVLGALRAVELKIVTTGGVVMTRFSENNEVRWGRADLKVLADMIARYERMVDRNDGRRTRYAKTMRFAPERF